MSSLRYYTRLSMIEQVNNLISYVVFTLLSPAKNRTGEKYYFKCRPCSAVALPKIEQVKNTISMSSSLKKIEKGENAI
jgi:hypothetical protein